MCVLFFFVEEASLALGVLGFDEFAKIRLVIAQNYQTPDHSSKIYCILGRSGPFLVYNNKQPARSVLQ